MGMIGYDLVAAIDRHSRIEGWDGMRLSEYDDKFGTPTPFGILAIPDSPTSFHRYQSLSSH
jgi:hypothetical protein